LVLLPQHVSEGPLFIFVVHDGMLIPTHLFLQQLLPGPDLLETVRHELLEPLVLVHQNFIFVPFLLE
jgi:hypothetical protein